MITKKNIFCLAIAFNGIVCAMDLAPEIPPRYKLTLVNLKEEGANRPTTFAERRNYGYHGFKIPIKKEANVPGLLLLAGCILVEAQPSILAGYSYADSHVLSNRIFIEDNNLKYEATIKERASDTRIHSSCIFGNPQAHTMSGTLAILWEDLTLPQKMYITTKRLAAIQEQDNQMDLDKNKVELGMVL